MSSNNINRTVGALILVPIIIAASAAFIAVKATDYIQVLTKYLSKSWKKNRLRTTIGKLSKKSHRRYKSRSIQTFADSWCDIESTCSGQGSVYNHFQGQEILERPHTLKSGIIWHPSRASRLAWSFASPISLNHNLFGLSNVAKPSAIARRQEKVLMEDLALPTLSISVREVPR
ncbi:BgTH12-01329 [Blumeria graminis f. sp. triticale]|uniref:Bgt-4525 n=3 Tax=Blumeria graminis TaxID=34373 RepID=A0A061HLF8_BLUGR|nr:hypothetical protein BGT96224_4525 [Blumeria graminis f. sp. tritici 96224]CAD6505842.1 BgTH12-01329 [Blumeria graminis f. sp. triticale]VDB94016.1 Bgt-4525 [Blumeria graminis f. sp. tritici]